MTEKDSKFLSASNMRNLRVILLAAKREKFMMIKKAFFDNFKENEHKFVGLTLEQLMFQNYQIKQRTTFLISFYIFHILKHDVLDYQKKYPPLIQRFLEHLKTDEQKIEFYFSPIGYSEKFPGDHCVILNKSLSLKHMRSGFILPSLKLLQMQAEKYLRSGNGTDGNGTHGNGNGSKSNGKSQEDIDRSDEHMEDILILEDDLIISNDFFRTQPRDLEINHEIEIDWYKGNKFESFEKKLKRLENKLSKSINPIAPKIWKMSMLKKLNTNDEKEFMNEIINNLKLIVELVTEMIFAKLMEHNKKIALFLIERCCIMKMSRANDYKNVLICKNGDTIALSKIEIMNELVSKKMISTEEIILFISNKIKFVNEMQHSINKNRMLSLIGLFVLDLLKKKVIKVGQVKHMLKGFCVKNAKNVNIQKLLQLLNL